jgi:hypothetical protein
LEETEERQQPSRALDPDWILGQKEVVVKNLVKFQ